MLDLVYWRQPAYTGAVFSALLLLLFSLSIFSAISVFAHVALLGLAATLSFVSFKKVAAAVQKTGEGLYYTANHHYIRHESYTCKIYIRPMCIVQA